MLKIPSRVLLANFRQIVVLDMSNLADRHSIDCNDGHRRGVVFEHQQLLTYNRSLTGPASTFVISTLAAPANSGEAWRVRLPSQLTHDDNRHCTIIEIRSILPCVIGRHLLRNLVYRRSFRRSLRSHGSLAPATALSTAREKTPLTPVEQAQTEPPVFPGRLVDSC